MPEPHDLRECARTRNVGWGTDARADGRFSAETYRLRQVSARLAESSVAWETGEICLNLENQPQLSV